MKYKKVVVTAILLFSGIYWFGCSSSSETSGERTEKTKDEIIKPAPKPNEETEREFINRQNIKSVDKISFDYDEDGKLVNGEKQSTINYGPEGLIIETIIYGKNSQVDNIYKYDYDKHNHRIQTIRYTPDQKADKKYTYEYNKYGNKIKSVRYDLNGNMEKYYIYKYDDKQNLTGEEWYNADGKLEYRIENEYYESGKIKSAATFNEKDKMLYKYAYKYDTKGNVLEEEKFNADNEPAGVIQYVYKYYEK
jgi:hypothetical protein